MFWVCFLAKKALSGEATLLSTTILVGVALVLGIGMLSFVAAVLGNYRSQINLVNYLRYEAVNTYVNTILYDNTTFTLWLLFKRLDGSPGNYYVIIESGGVYLNCSRVYVYNPLSDANGVLCDDPGECVEASTLYRGRARGINALHPDGVMDFDIYLRAQNRPLPDYVEVCRIPSVCVLTGKQGFCDENTIVKVDLSHLALPVRIYVAVEYGGGIYVVGVYAPA